MKAIISFLLFFCVLCVFAQNNEHIVKKLSKKELGHLLSKKTDNNVVLAFMSKSCEKCETKLYDLNLAYIAFEDIKDLAFGTVEAETYPSLIKKYDIDLSSEIPEIRLIHKDKHYSSLTGENLIEFISSEFNITPKESNIIDLTPESHKAIVDAKKDILLEFYEPTCVQCQKLIWNMNQLALTWKTEPRVAITRIDCLKYERFCAHNNIKQYPTIKFFKSDPNAEPEDVSQPSTEEMMTLLNKKYKTKRVFGGGFDDEYGTSAKLSRLSKDFVDEPIREYKESILKDIKSVQLKKTPLYVKYLEKTLLEGNDYLVQELKTVQNKLDSVTFLDEQYPKLKREYNILKSIQPTDFNKLIELNTLNIDHYLNGHRNVLVVFIQKNHEKCKAFMEKYEKAVLRKPEGVAFAYLEGDTYSSLSSRYQLHTTPAYKWFAANADPKMPEEAGLGGSVDSIIDFVEEQINNQREMEQEEL